MIHVNQEKWIHLLYVPTMNCNMACKYCYLEDKTTELKTEHRAVETLQYAVQKLGESQVFPFNISLHGGEVTTLSPSEFREVISYITQYYEENGERIEKNGFKVGKPHIKTNLYQLEQHLVEY